MTSIRIPGLIDPHIHLRDPGQTHKEDFYMGTSAALAGGFTTIIDMPNNTEPIITGERLDNKIEEAKKKIICDVGFYFGSLGENIEEFAEIYDKVLGIKLYLNSTTGNYLIDERILDRVYSNWKSNSPILVHAEADVIGQVIKTVKQYGKRTHVCHVSSQDELNQIIKAKKDNLSITCGVTPHHLFLTENDVSKLGSFAFMKPSLKTKQDRKFLWENLNYIDCIESDHAPHTVEEKESAEPPFGVPGLETTLPLLLTAVSERKITLDKIVELCHENPKKIFNIPTDKNTKTEIDPNENWELKNENLFTKCRWSPFDGWKLKGKVKNVFIRGTKVFENVKILAKPGSGRVISSS